MSVHERLLVLWPTDLPFCEGICYGWASPLLCVAGIAPEPRGDADTDALQNKLKQANLRDLNGKLSLEPSIVARCTATPSSRELQLEVGGRFYGNEHIQLVYYRRHRRETMRFFAFDFREMDILPSQESVRTLVESKPLDGFLQADFTRSHVGSGNGGGLHPVLDDEVLAQLNLARYLADVVERGPRLASSTNAGRRAPPVKSSPLGTLHAYLRHFSATVEQLDVRLEQAKYVLRELPFVYATKARSTVAISEIHNCIWLVLNDIIIGAAVGSFLRDNSNILARMLEHHLRSDFVDRVNLALVWLNNWPAGLKLNTELSAFFCHTLIGIVSFWGWLLSCVAPHLPLLIWLVGAGGWLGMTMLVALLSDALSLCAAHLHACYALGTAVYAQQLTLLGSLWNLFRGKRYNVLRNRNDTWDYDLDQLLLGTILFVLTAFLCPTILTYYMLFALARLAVIMLHATLDTAAALLNHFPLFALLLRVKDPHRIPGGVCVTRADTGSLTLESQPAALSSIFGHYAHLGGRLFAHYHPLRMAGGLASGRLLRPIARAAIRYSMIPASGVTVRR